MNVCPTCTLTVVKSMILPLTLSASGGRPGTELLTTIRMRRSLEASVMTHLPGTLGRTTPILPAQPAAVRGAARL